MANIESRLATLEQLQRNARPALVIFSRLGQQSQSPEQAAQIEQAERQGREVKIIYTRVIPPG